MDPSGESHRTGPGGQCKNQPKTSNACGEGVYRALAATKANFRDNRNLN